MLKSTQEFIKTELIKSNGKLNPSKLRFNQKWIKSHHLSVYYDILIYTNFLDNINPIFSQRLYHIINNINTTIKCKHCNKLAIFDRFTVGYKTFCSTKCANRFNQPIREQTNIEKYGVKHAVISENSINKKKQTCLEKYGHDHHFKNKEIRKKIQSTKLKRYGDEFYTNSERFKQTCLEKYGTKSPLSNPDIRCKIRKTCLEKYGNEIPSKTNDIINKIIDSQQDTNFKEVVKKREQTCLKRYNEKYFSKSVKGKKQLKKNCDIKFDGILSDILHKIKTTTDHKILDSFAENSHDKIKLKCIKGHIFDRTVNWLSYNTSCPLCNNNKSKQETVIYDFLKNEKFDNILSNKKSIIPPYELDIYLPEKQIAIEYDGIYWHSELQGKDKHYHLNKTQLCEERGIQLLHIFENEWLYKQEIVKSILLAKIGSFETKIYARKCVVKEIDNKTKDIFLNDNHLQGKDNSSIKLGLFHNDELVAVMTFGNRQITGGDSKFELIRFCNKLNTQIIGGASKLFKHFINNYWNKEEITTYSDRRYSNGNFYEKLGFKFSHVSAPNYFYFKGIDLENRINYQKHKLKDKLEVFDEKLTEWENMKLNGYNRIWDCGNLVYKYNRDMI